MRRPDERLATTGALLEMEPDDGKSGLGFHGAYNPPHAAGLDTGGCRDGLMADGINQNEGAESSLAWLLSLITLQRLYAEEIVNQPVSPKAGE